MQILSLYNGISCGHVAFQRLGIPVKRYVSYEIEKHANAIARFNFPNDEYNGDVTTADFTEYKGFDWVIGGSPCTHWSIAKKDREITSDGIGFELFSHFARAIKEVQPKYFLYENNKSIHKDIKNEITKALGGVEHIMINAALLSAQNRERCYWVGIKQSDNTYRTASIKQPNDLGILLKDILVSGQDLLSNNKSYCLTSSYNGAVAWNTIERKQRSMVAEPTRIPKYSKDKSRCLGSMYSANVSSNLTEKHRIFSDNPNKQQLDLIATPLQLGHISNTNSQANRVYSVKGKSVCLQSASGGGGAKTGLYKLDLPDGDYTIRKLYPIEAERLMTLPDNFSLMGDYSTGDKRHNGVMKVADTNRYKGIGNGWVVDVIAYLIKNVLIENSI